MTIKVTYNVTDVYVTQDVSPVYINVSYSGGGLGAAVWGGITGTLSNQTDLQNALNAKYNNPTGTTSQYLRGDGSLATFPAIPSGTVTSVGLTMPSAFSVANSPVTSSGTLAVTGAGTSAQYIRGDGQLGNFPDNQGGGSSVNYYLNGSVTQGTFGGVTYYEMSKTPILGAGTNFTRTNAQGNGYIASFITDAGDPSLLNIPAGNWNVEFYFQANSNAGNPQFYAELYKVDASNNFTLVGSGSTNPEGITNGTTVDQYYTAIPVPQTSLLVTDRLAIRIFVITSGRTITLHTENSNLCEILTTFSTGLNALNGLTAQVQYFATGTSGTDFGISSATDTHTFNLPTASSINRGALSSADWTTFNNKISGSGASGQVAYWDGATSQAGSTDLQWNGTNVILGNDKGLVLQTAGTNKSTRILPNNVVDNFSSLTFYPNSGTNVGQSFNVIPRGTGLNSALKAQFFVFNSDFVADQTNWEGMLFRAAGTSFTLATGKAGTGTIRPLLLSAGFADGTTNANHLWLYTNGNVGINTSSDSGQRLQVTGTSLFTGQMTAGAILATTLRLGNSTSNSPFLFSFVSDSGTPDSSGRNLSLYSYSLSSTGGAFTLAGDTFSPTSGAHINFRLINTFAPTSGTASLAIMQMNWTINQTGGANGITRGLYVNPTLTAAADFRAIEWSNNSGWGLYGAGTAPNYLNGRLGIGVLTSGIWSSYTSVLQVGQGFFTDFSPTPQFAIGSNIYFNGTNSIVLRTGGTGILEFANDGAINFWNGISQTAGATSSATIKMKLFSSTGNLLLQNGGTFTDSGERLQVTGDVKIVGSGATSGTTALRVQNSSSTNLFVVRNDGNVGIGTVSPTYKLDVTNQARVAGANGSVGTIGGSNYALSLQNNSTATWLEILNNGGINKGIFFGITTNAFELWNYQGGTIDFYTNTSASAGTKRITIKTTGQLRFHPLASAPSGAEAGDVYYDSTLSKLRVYTTAWETITSV